MWMKNELETLLLWSFFVLERDREDSKGETQIRKLGVRLLLGAPPPCPFSHTQTHTPSLAVIVNQHCAVLAQGLWSSVGKSSNAGNTSRFLRLSFGHLNDKPVTYDWLKKYDKNSWVSWVHFNICWFCWSGFGKTNYTEKSKLFINSS